MRDTKIGGDANSSRDRLHFIVAVILTALLLSLPLLFGIGPNLWKNCALARPSAAAPTTEISSIGSSDSARGRAETAQTVASSVEQPPRPARVSFDLDRHALPGDIETTLADIIAYLKRHPKAKSELRGFHDWRGDADRNRALASERAISVSDYLIAAGIGADRVVIAAPAETTGSGSKAEAQRVEVAIAR